MRVLAAHLHACGRGLIIGFFNTPVCKRNIKVLLQPSSCPVSGWDRRTRIISTEEPLVIRKAENTAVHLVEKANGLHTVHTSSQYTGETGE